MESETVEVKQIYNINRLPLVFSLAGRRLERISFVSSFLQCINYSSRTGKTYSTCVELKNNYFEKTISGVVLITAPAILKIESRRKLYRDAKDQLNYIKQFVNTNPLTFDSKKLLIYFDNESIEIYDKYIKGKKLQFYNHSLDKEYNLYRVPLLPDWLERHEIDTLTINNLTLHFSKPIKYIKPITPENTVMYIESPEENKITFNNTDNKEVETGLKPGAYLIEV